jgi:hypothetical protein
MSQLPFPRILLQRGHPIREGTLTSGTSRLLTDTPLLASSSIASCQEPEPTVSTGHWLHLPSGLVRGCSPARDWRRWLNASIGESARMRYQTPGFSSSVTPAATSGLQGQVEQILVIAEQEYPVEDVHLVVCGLLLGKPGYGVACIAGAP